MKTLNMFNKDIITAIYHTPFLFPAYLTLLALPNFTIMDKINKSLIDIVNKTKRSKN